MIGDKASKDGGALRAGLQFIHLVNSDRPRTNLPIAPEASQVAETAAESLPVEMTWQELLQFKPL